MVYIQRVLCAEEVVFSLFGSIFFFSLIHKITMPPKLSEIQKLPKLDLGGWEALRVNGGKEVREGFLEEVAPELRCGGRS